MMRSPGDLAAVDWRRIGTSAALGAAISLRACLKKSLTPEASVVAFGVGYLTATVGWVPFAALLTFFVTSTFITKIGKNKKRKIEADYNPQGHRSVWQVLCNGGAASALVLWHGLFAPGGSLLRPAVACDTPLGRAVVLSIVAHYAACQGDTWSSEIGVLSPFAPRLVTTFRRVPAGTNGAVSITGSLASLVGGAVIAAAGSAALYCAPSLGLSHRDVWTVSLAAAVGGSLLDSLLGATLQYSGQREDGVVVNEPGEDVRHISGVSLLTNNAVNFLSAAAVLAVTMVKAL